MTYRIIAVDETWGDNRLLSDLLNENYADTKALISHTIDTLVKDVTKRGAEYRVRSLPEKPGEYFGAVVEWCADGQLAPLDASDEGFIRDRLGLQQAVVVEAYRQ